MSNKTGAQLVTAVRQQAARTNDTVLITETFVLEALNEGQLHIVRMTPRIVDLDKSDQTTYRVTRWTTTATAVTVAVRASTGVVTLTAAGHDLEVGDIATVADVENNTDFSGQFEILSVASNDITYFQNKVADTGVGATFGTIVKLAGKASLDISTLNPAHIGGLWLLNGAQTRRRGLHYRELTDFRGKYILTAEEAPSEPTEYTRQGSTLLFNRPVSSDYMGLRFKIDYTAFATDLLNGAVASELPDSNKGLILFALAETYDKMALSMPQFETKAIKTRVLFNSWLDEWRDYQEMLIEELYDSNYGGD